MKIPAIPGHGTVFYTSGGHKASAVLLGEEFAVTSALIFSDNVEYAKTIADASQKTSFIEIGKSQSLKDLHQLDFRIVRKNGHELLERKARACYIVHSRRAHACLENLLNGLQICLDGEIKPMQDYSTLFSSFLILTTNPSRVPLWRSVIALLEQVTQRNNEPLKLLDKVVAISTPFGNESFFNTINVGHVCNILDDDGCMLLLDIPLNPGSEGGALYDQRMKLRGFFIGSSYKYRGDIVTLPLAISVDEILYVGRSERNLCQRVTHSFPQEAFRSVCMIDSQGCWGTGCAFELKGKRYIISCAHVLSTDNVTCFFGDQRIMHPRVLYKNPVFDSAYDVALMEASYDEVQPNGWFCRLANYIPAVGQRIYSVGFPVFKSLASKLTFKPSIVPGRVTKYTEGILFTDCSIQYGQSGGPIFDEKGLLVAIAVSNFKSSLDNRIYPFHNMCIPVQGIYATLAQYADTEDKSSLAALQADWDVRSSWKLKPPKILNKL
ncbi:uncharacterized protein LOC118462605 isoform X1 [Anopheles albimanus]|uniref:uncharacterized protein LOC118462605 isoform X1 n=1 Tax=Anopheles albimanus TaxID=7167 RepID=UPI00163EAC9E|nr:uncharacterized protein LOC118462605 isoform X1 [Anopheles albimanus]